MGVIDHHNGMRYQVLHRERTSLLLILCPQVVHVRPALTINQQ